MIRIARRWPTTFVGVLLLLAGGIAGALDGLSLEVQGVRGSGWGTGPIRIELDLGAANELSFTARARALVLPAPLHEARVAKLRCPRAAFESGHWQCSAASVQIEFSDREVLRFRAAVSVNPQSGSLRLRVRNQPFAGGVLSVTLDSQAGALEVDASFSGLSLAIMQQLATLLHGALPVTASSGDLAGAVRISAKGGVHTVDARLQLQAGAFSDESGSNAGEGLQLRTELSATMKRADAGAGGTWHFESDSSLDAGVLYAAPVLLEIGVHEAAPVSARVRGQWGPDGQLQITQMALRDSNVLQLDASALLAIEPELVVERFTIDVPQQSIAALYTRYLKPFAGAGAAADLRVQGAVSAGIDWSRQPDGTAKIVSSVHLARMDVGDSQGQFSILGLEGDLFWRSAEVDSGAVIVSDASPPATAPLSNLRWRSIQVRALELGAGALQLRLAGQDVDLLAPLQVELLDGAVQIERLQGRAMGTPQQRLEVQLSVLPISLRRLSDRLAWLPLSGSIAGRIPNLILTADTLRVDGDVNMDLFDGKARIANLRVKHPFSAVSRLHTDLFVDGIDLGILSRAFSFGQIEGRLDGEARGLVLENWQPVAFDAVFSTPPNDTSRHRISQRAVENLASLGGAQAVLSSTFLRFFEEFSYARLGLRCRLRRGICEMDGVAPAEPGYYIVEGGGMPPRVDVVGFNRRVDWRTLLDRLKAVTSSAGPIIR